MRTTELNVFLFHYTEQQNEAVCYRSHRHLASVKRDASKEEGAHLNNSFVWEPEKLS